MLPNFKTTLSGYVSYQGRIGHVSFLLHRITGLGTLLFLTFHVLITASVYFSPQWYNRLMAAFGWPPVMAAEIVLVFCVIYHGVNGLRIAYFDLFKPQMWRLETTQKAARFTLITAILLWLPAAAIMSYNLLKFGLGLFGGE